MPVTVRKGDLTKVKNVDVIVNASNGIGVMGAGVAGAIRRAAGDAFGAEVRKIAMTGGPREEGTVFFTPPGDLAKNNVKGVLHAVTMKYPGGGTSYNTVDRCLEAIFSFVKVNGFQSVALTGLGTGIGNLNKEIVAKQTMVIAKRQNSLDVFIVSLDDEFITSCSNLLG